MPKSDHNAAHYFIETHLEAGRGEAIAFIEAASGKRISYSTLSANSSKVAGALLGGAAGAAMSRNEGRWWAIPLGAVVGSKIGCDAAGG